MAALTLMACAACVPSWAVDITAVGAGGGHTCALTTTGGVKCWGGNDSGELGNDSTDYSSLPVDVADLRSGVTALSVGDDYNCVVTTSGGVKCWGDTIFGELGNGNPGIPYGSSPVPTDVVGLSSGVVAVAAGYGTTCAVTTSGGVKCWGYGRGGFLGEGSTTDSPVPVDVVGLESGIVFVATGSGFNCALTVSGGVKCWGGKVFGPSPVDVSGLTSDVAALSVGFLHACAVTTGGGVKCWGDSYLAALGDGSTTSSWVPVDVSGLSGGIAAVSAGSGHTCALTTAGGVKCWGENSLGQLGDPSVGWSPVPVDVSDLSSGVAAVSAGGAHTCAMTTSGGVKCWGDNIEGQLGDGMMRLSALAVAISGLEPGVVAITATGSQDACALLTTGGVRCWGSNFSGEIGNGSIMSSWVPLDVSGLTSGVVAISGGSEHTCALTSTGGVKCWGDNGWGQLANGGGPSSALPVDVSGLSSGVVAIGANGYDTCALTSAGGVECWGANYLGSLGDGSTTNRSLPVDVVGLSSGVVAISVGGGHTCALMSTGEVKCWGFSRGGLLGDGSTTGSAVPVSVSGISNAKAVSAGSGHTCALLTTGEVKCWGANNYGQLGDGSTLDRPVPVRIPGVSEPIVAISAGVSHTCSVGSSGSLRCWGDNSDGQLGNGSVDYELHRRPRLVFGSSSGVVAVSAGESRTCAVMASGEAKCWGDSGYGNPEGWPAGPISLVPKDTILPGHRCSLTPAPACRAAARTFLSIKETARSRGTFWSWTHGAPTDTSEFGNPTGTTRYALCLYEAGGLKVEEDMGWDCGPNESCWDSFHSNALRYRKRRILLVGSDQDESAIIAKRTEAISTPALPLTPPVIVQWRNTMNDTCWGATYTSADIRRATATGFSALTR